MRRQVDVTTLFDAKARPLTSYEAMEARIKLLEHQLARAIRMLRRQQMMGVEDRPPASANHTIN